MAFLNLCSANSSIKPGHPAAASRRSRTAMMYQREASTELYSTLAFSRTEFSNPFFQVTWTNFGKTFCRKDEDSFPILRIQLPSEGTRCNQILEKIQAAFTLITVKKISIPSWSMLIISPRAAHDRWYSRE